MQKVTENAWWLFAIAPGLILLLVIRWLTHLEGLTGIEITAISLAITFFIYGVILSLTAFFVWLIRMIPRFTSLTVNFGDWRVLLLASVVACIAAVPSGVIVASALERDFGRQAMRSMADWLFASNEEYVLPRGSSTDTLHSLLRRMNSRQENVWPLDFRTQHSRVFRTLSDASALECGTLFGTCNLRLRVYSQNRMRGVEGFPADWHGHGERSQVFLSPACQLYVNDGWTSESRGSEFNAVLVRGPGVWVSLAGSNAEIEILDAHSSPCEIAFEEEVCSLVNQQCIETEFDTRPGGDQDNQVDEAICAWRTQCGTPGTIESR